MATTETTLDELKVPSLRAHMGDWVYYVTFLRLRDIAERVSLAQKLHTSRVLKDLIQREVDESVHAQSIKRYLLHQEQRLFNSLVIAVYGGTPTWVELEIEESSKWGAGPLPKYIKGALGVLLFHGTEKLFALDGQHRVVGIKKALAENPGLADEEVSVIFVGHSNDRKGLQRSRRLFTTLNRYAKPVNKTQLIALDEDDAIAITTRRLLEDYRLFTEFTSEKKGKSIAVNDRVSFTTIVALYDAMDRYFGLGLGKEWKDFKRQRPSDRRLEEVNRDAVQLWDAVIAVFPPLQELVESDPKDAVAGKYRNRYRGGHVLFRPIGLLMVITVVKYLINEGYSLRQALTRVSAAPMDLSKKPWIGLLWDPANRRMIYSAENQKVATRLLYHGSGGDLTHIQTTPSKLRAEWAGIVEQQVKLPNWNQ